MSDITIRFPTDWEAPQRGESQEAFSTKANIAWAKLRDPLIPNLNTFAGQANALRVEVNSRKLQTEQLRNAAALEATNAATQATAAGQLALSAQGHSIQAQQSAANATNAVNAVSDTAYALTQIGINLSYITDGELIMQYASPITNITRNANGEVIITY